MNKQTCILVLGMHRSGTSALTGVLEMLGVYLSGTTKGDKNNEKGYFENGKVQRLNDRIFSQLDSGWDDEFFSLSKLESLPHITNELKIIISEDFEYSKLFAIKDPRVCLLFPLWGKALKELDVDVKIILPYRNPVEVATSLHKRNGMSVEKGMLLWAYHFLLAEKFSREYERVFVSFDDLMSDTEKVINEISSKLTLDFKDKYAKHRNEISGFLEPGLKHHNISIENLSANVPNIIKDILSLRSGFNNENLSEKFDALRNQLFGYQKLFYHDDIVMLVSAGELAKSDLQKKEVELSHKEQLLHENEKKLRKTSESISKMDDDLRRVKKNYKQKAAALNMARKSIQENQSELSAAKYEIHMKEIEVDRLQTELANIYMSKSWKFTRLLRVFVRTMRK